MADIQLYKAGVFVPNYMWKKGDHPRTGPPFAPSAFGERIPPYNAQFDGNFNVKDYTAGFPLIPADNEAQRNALKTANPQVGDILQLILVPTNHYVDFLRFDVHLADIANTTSTPPYPGMTGAAVALTAQRVEYNPTTQEYEFTEIPDVTDALAAQGLPATIPLDMPSTVMVSLLRVEAGYVQPLYAPPILRTIAGPPVTYFRDETGGIMLGLKITALPADVHLELALNDYYLAARVRAFDCPAF